jgi:hypothetical protein
MTSLLSGRRWHMSHFRLPAHATSARRAAAIMGLVLGTLIVTILVRTAISSASCGCIVNYYNNAPLQDGTGVFGPRHSIILNDAYNRYNLGVCVTAYNTDGSQAGNWVCNGYEATHSYCGCALRTPEAYNNDQGSGQDPFYAQEEY